MLNGISAMAKIMSLQTDIISQETAKDIILRFLPEPLYNTLNILKRVHTMLLAAHRSHM